jgi:hypothetical protein
MALAVAAGLMMTLYRNDILSSAAQSSGSEGVYSKVESAFGQPGFGTTRSIEELAALVPNSEPISPVPAAAPASTTATSEATTEENLPEKVSLDDAEEEGTEASPAKGANKATKKATTNGMPRKVLRKPAAKKQSLKKFKGNEYDPMNASL